MSFDIPVNSTDAIVLVILLVLLIFGVRMVLSFFKTPAKKQKKVSEEVTEQNENNM